MIGRETDWTPFEHRERDTPNGGVDDDDAVSFSALPVSKVLSKASTFCLLVEEFHFSIFFTIFGDLWDCLLSATITALGAYTISISVKSSCWTSPSHLLTLGSRPEGVNKAHLDRYRKHQAISSTASLTFSGDKSQWTPSPPSSSRR